METGYDCCIEPNALLDELDRRAHGMPLLALGQTVFWDEPMKAVLLPYLQGRTPSRPFYFGIHDTDYFARLPLRAIPSQWCVAQGFAMVPHNDGTTRALWSAAGEISQLFGSETIPTRAKLQSAGAQVERVAQHQPEGRTAYIDRITEAWGWRGLVSLEDHPRPVCEISLQSVLPALEALLEWGMHATCQRLTDPERRQSACDRYEGLLTRIEQIASALPEGNLADLYRYLYRDMLVGLVGEVPEMVGFTRTTELLQFNTDTAQLPRFRLVDLFVNPETRALCEHAYNSAVAGTEVYTLDEFGEGALPFDLLVPQRGRGTLLLTHRYLTVLTPEPIVVRLKQPIQSVRDLAEVVESQIERHCTLVGKAITLITMLAHEFVFVFSERGSPYTTRTQRMNRILREGGIELPISPIVRVRYPTWDALGSATSFPMELPDHLAEAFGKRMVSSDQFALSWRSVVQEQSALLNRLASLHRPRDLMRFLAERGEPDWQARLDEYESLHAQLREVGAQAEALRRQAHALHAERHALIQQLHSEPKRARELQSRIQQLKLQIRRLNQERVQVGRTETVRTLRQRAHAIELDAERARIEMARNALLTAEGLPQTQARPSAWWFLLTGNGWFEACVKGVQLALEQV